MSFQLISLSREEVDNINSIVCGSGNQVAAEQTADAIKESNEDKFIGILMDILNSIRIISILLLIYRKHNSTRYCYFFIEKFIKKKYIW